MTKKQAIQLFEEQKVRTIWDDEEEKWYFCVVDVVEVLTDSANPQTYWRVLKNRLKKEGNETVTNCNALKMRAADGKMRLTLDSVYPLSQGRAVQAMDGSGGQSAIRPDAGPRTQH